MSFQRTIFVSITVLALSATTVFADFEQSRFRRIDEANDASPFWGTTLFPFFDGNSDWDGQSVFLSQRQSQSTARDSVGASSLTGSSDNIWLSRDQNLTLSGAPGETVTVNLQNFVLSGNASLTLSGTATTTFIINVSDQFSLSKSASIVLANGIQWQNVFFNVLGPGRAVVLRGSSYLVGTLTAPGRTVKLDGHATVYGQVFANQIVIRGAAQIITPPPASP